MGRPYDIKDRSFLFATEIIDFCKPVMPPGGVVRELARQLLRSGTSIGANLEEAAAGQSKPDFRSKVAISRKEARESGYWLRLLVHADARLKDAADPLLDETRAAYSDPDHHQNQFGAKRQTERRNRGRMDRPTRHSSFSIRHSSLTSCSNPNNRPAQHVCPNHAG
jgi:four helix bundle protein